ncbi:MAG: hypothetical protein JST13_14275 [Bacteroidetes bacterium]|nr:hypothetical protein [Bacteroidota bacterium]
MTDNKTLNNSNNDIIENISPENSNPQGIAESRLSYAHSGLAPLAINRSAIIISDSSLLAEAGKISRQPTGKRSLNTNRPLEIGIVFGPDYSKVKYAYTDTKLGSSVGLAIGYHLLSRLSVNTAIIYTHKYYEVDGHHFHPGPGAARPNGDIEFVKGSFKMFEVPLNFRYDFSFEDNTSFFIGAGSSSYLMQGEDYNYFCHYNLAASAWVNQPAADPRKNFWFSTFNLSGGFETYLSKNISFQLEPYIKLPLRKIGLGNVSLSSYGINLAIKFSPALKKSRH